MQLASLIMKLAWALEQIMGSNKQKQISLSPHFITYSMLILTMYVHV